MKWRIILKTVKLYLKQNIFSYRFVAVSLFLASYYSIMGETIMQIYRDTGYKINYAMIPIMMGTYTMLLVMLVGWVLLIANVPFRDVQQIQILVRIGKKKWIISQIIYVMIMTGVYLLLNIILFSLFSIRAIGFYSDWGKLATSIVQGTSDIFTSFRQVLLLEVSTVILEKTPTFVFCIQVIVFYTIFLLIGWITLLGNFIKKYLGFIIVFFMLFLYLFVGDSSGYLIYYISPISWINIWFFLDRVSGTYPSVSYILSSLSAAYLLLGGIVVKLMYQTFSVDIKGGR